jgi:hypothetical protein
MDFNEAVTSIWKLLPDANTIAAFAGAASAIAAFRAIRRNDENLRIERKNADDARRDEQRRSDEIRENERLLNHATTTLERAFLALRGPDTSITHPPRNRLNWLTAARLIEEYKKTKARMRDPLLLQECESHEEHWRHQFYLKLIPLADGHPDYFQHSTDSENNIQPTSAVVVHAFASWPEGKTDPLRIYRSETDAIEKLGIEFYWFNLQRALERP